MEFLQRRRRTILAGVAGAVSAQLGCGIMFWFISFGPTFWEVLYFMVLRVIWAPITIGVVAGLLTPPAVSHKRLASFLSGALATILGLVLFLRSGWQLGPASLDPSPALETIVLHVASGLVSLAVILFVMGAIAWLRSRW